MPPPILIVDDEPVVRRLASTILTRAGFPTAEATDGQDAISQLQSLNGAVALVVSDIRMPNMDGLELAKIVRKQFPHVRVILMSAFSYDPVPHGKTRWFIPKPFTAAALVSSVRAALEPEKSCPAVWA